MRQHAVNRALDDRMIAGRCHGQTLQTRSFNAAPPRCSNSKYDLFLLNRLKMRFEKPRTRSDRYTRQYLVTVYDCLCGLRNLFLISNVYLFYFLFLFSLLFCFVYVTCGRLSWRKSQFLSVRYVLS